MLPNNFLNGVKYLTKKTSKSSFFSVNHNVKKILPP